MPFLDPQLPENEVRLTIAFLRGLQRNIRLLTYTTASASGYNNPAAYANAVPTDIMFALSDAAELAFALGDIGLALTICNDIYRARPRTPMQFVLWATAGAISGRGEVLLTPTGALARTLGKARRQDSAARSLLPWPVAVADISFLATALIPAAVASGTFETHVLGMFDVDGKGDSRVPGLALTLISASDEYTAAMTSAGLFRQDDQRWSDGFASLELAYVHRMRLIRKAPGWQEGRPQGSIIDWKLLALEVALRRNTHLEVYNFRPPPESVDVEFIRNTATLVSSKVHRRTSLSGSTSEE